MQEERDPAPLLLLGCDQLVGEPRVLRRELLQLLLDPLVHVALGDEQRGGEGSCGCHGEDQAEERDPLRADREPDHAHDGAGHDQRDQQQRSSR